MTKYGYVRVSSNSQEENFSIENQCEALIARGVDRENIVTEIHSGTILQRPALSKLITEVKANDIIYVVRLDRFARNTLEALITIAKLEKKEVELIPLDFPEIENKSIRQLFRNIILFFAEFEYEQRKIRQMEGISKAKAAGKYKGRKAVITPKLIAEVKNLLYTRNYKKEHLANCLKISRSTLYKVLKELENHRQLEARNE